MEHRAKIKEKLGFERERGLEKTGVFFKG